MNDIVKQDTQLAPVAELGSMPIATAIYFDDRLYARVEQMATRIAKSEIMVPDHIRGKPDVAFAVIVYALTWKLNPYAVACATYQPVAGARVGFEGKLIAAIIENSGRLEPGTGGVHFEHYGDWTKIQGHFQMRKSEKGREYAVSTWTDDDARAGACGVRVWAHVRGELQPRELRFDLIQAQPRNSTLWATDARTQLCYTAVRRFGNLIVPSLLMGAQFEAEEITPSQTEREVAGETIGVEQPTQKMRNEESTVSEAVSAGHAAEAAAETKSETIDKQTGEITGAKQPPGETKQPPGEENSGPLLSAEQRRFVAIKMQRATLTEGDFVNRFGCTLGEAPASKVNEVLKWVDDPMGG